MNFSNKILKLLKQSRLKSRGKLPLDDTTKDFTVRKLKVGGVSINYAQVGKGKPLVFIHGWANNWAGWTPLASILKSKYALYLIDLPGFGDSDPLKEYSIEREAKYASLFLKKLEIKPEAIIGLSMGSLVTAQIGKDYPESAKSIILLGGVFKTDNHSLIASMLEKSLAIINGHKKTETLIKKAIETRMTAYLMAKYINMHQFNKFLVDTYGMIGKKKMTKEAFIQMGLSAANFKLEKMLDNCSLPVFLIYGKEDKITSLEHAQKLLKNKKGHFHFAHVPFAGHVAPLEKPESVAKLIVDFIKKL